MAAARWHIRTQPDMTLMVRSQCRGCQPLNGRSVLGQRSIVCAGSFLRVEYNTQWQTAHNTPSQLAGQTQRMYIQHTNSFYKHTHSAGQQEVGLRRRSAGKRGRGCVRARPRPQQPVSDYAKLYEYREGKRQGSGAEANGPLPPDFIRIRYGNISVLDNGSKYCS